MNSVEELQSFLHAEMHSDADMLIDTQLAIGYQRPADNTIKELVAMIVKLKEYTFYNVREKLDVFIDQKKVMEDYLFILNHLLAEAKMMKERLTIQLQNYKRNELVCRNQKQYYDREFFTAIDNLQEYLMQESMDKTIVNEWCATESRVKYKVYKLLYDQLANYLRLLEKRYIYRNKRRTAVGGAIIFSEE